MKTRSKIVSLGLVVAGLTTGVPVAGVEGELSLPVWKVSTSLRRPPRVQAGFLSEKGHFSPLFDCETNPVGLEAGWWIDATKWELLVREFPEARALFYVCSSQRAFGVFRVSRITVKSKTARPRSSKPRCSGSRAEQSATWP